MMSFYRLLTSGINDAQGRLFSNAKPNSVYGKIFSEKMNQDSFDANFGRTIQKTLKNPRTAVFQSNVLIWSDEKYSCRVIPILLSYFNTPFLMIIIFPFLNLVQRNMDKAIFIQFHGNVQGIAIFKVHETSHS